MVLWPYELFSCLFVSGMIALVAKDVVLCVYSVLTYTTDNYPLYSLRVQLSSLQLLIN